jgi:hypothetical protein
MSNLIQIRGGTASSATAANPVLAARELGVETDTGKIKVGNGVTAWNSLPYSAGGSSGNSITALNDVSVGFIVKSFDNSPGADIFQCQYQDGTIVVAAGTGFNTNAIGYISAVNVFPNRLWVTTTTTAPASWVNGDFWLGPAT